MKIHIVMHESFEAPGAIGDWIVLNNIETSYTRLYEGDALPDNAENFDCLIIMGGPQSANTTIAECPYFDVKKELAFIQKAIAKNKFILGICLGAQLIGEALGASFEHSPHREIGVYELRLTKEGKEDPIIGLLPENFMVGHWHGDMPGLTKESKILASSEACPRQIIKYAPKIYAFQCHFEFTPASIEGMIENCIHELNAYESLPYVESVTSLRSHNYEPMNSLLFKFLDWVLATQSRFAN